MDAETGELSPRKCDLRAFVLTGNRPHVWYSGLTRYSSIPGEMIVNSSQGGGFKDTWVLSSKTRATRDSSPGTEPGAPLRTRPHELMLVTPSKAEFLYWLGRYTERVHTTLALFLPYYDRMIEGGPEAFRPFARALDLPEDFSDLESFLRSLLYDASNPNSVRSALEAAFNDATILRPELGTRLLQYLELAMANIERAAGGSDPAGDLFDHRNVIDDLLADMPEPRLPGEHRNEAVHLAVDLDRLDDLRPVGLQAAVEVVEADTPSASPRGCGASRLTSPHAGTRVPRIGSARFSPGKARRTGRPPPDPAMYDGGPGSAIVSGGLVKKLSFDYEMRLTASSCAACPQRAPANRSWTRGSSCPPRATLTCRSTRLARSSPAATSPTRMTPSPAQ